MFRTKFTLESLKIQKIHSNTEVTLSTPTEDYYSTEDAQSMTPSSEKKLFLNSVSFKNGF